MLCAHRSVPRLIAAKTKQWEGPMPWKKRDIWMRMEVFVAVAVVLAVVISQRFN